MDLERNFQVKLVQTLMEWMIRKTKPCISWPEVREGRIGSLQGVLGRLRSSVKCAPPP